MKPWDRVDTTPTPEATSKPWDKAPSVEMKPWERGGEAPVEEISGNEFTRGVKRGTATTAALVAEGIPAISKGALNDLANAFGFEDIADPRQHLEEYQRKVQEAYEKHPTNVPTFKDIHGVKDAGAYVASAAGEQMPQLGLSLLGGGVGGQAAKQAVTQLAKRGGTKLTQQQANKALKKGLVGGTALASGSQNIPESYFNLLETTTGGDEVAGKAIIAGALKTGLDSLPQVQMLEKVLGPRAGDMVGDTLLKRIGREGGKAALKEGATEAVQEGVDILAEQFVNENAEIFTPENFDRLVDSGLKGAIGGGIMGAAASPLMGDTVGQSFSYDSLSPKQKNTLDDSIVIPTYVEQETLDQADELGLKQESLTNLSPVDIEKTQKRLKNISEKAPKSLQEVYTNPDFANVTPQISDSLAFRQAALAKGERSDTMFMPGDGEIVVGAETNPSAVLSNHDNEVKVVDTGKLEKSTSRPAPQKKPSVLPKALRDAKPRFNTSKLAFASDLDKALYIAGNPKRTANKVKEYTNWLKKETGMTEQEIVVQRKEMLDTLNNNAQHIEDLETVNVPKQLDTTKLQRLELPAYGNLRDDLVVPQVIHNNLKGVELSPKAIQKDKQLLNQLDRIVKEVAGEAINVKPFKTLTDFQNNPVAGAQFMNTVYVAINEATRGLINETAYHEAYHALEDLGAFSAKEMAIIDANTPVLVKYMNKDGYLKGQDFQVLLSTPTGRQELRANAFGKWSIEQRAKENNNKSLDKMFKNLFKKAKNMLERMGNAYKGLGFRTLNDIFKDGLEGRKAQDVLSDVNHDVKTARLQKISEEFRDAHIEEQTSEELFESLLREKTRLTNDEYNTGKELGWYGRWIRSSFDTANRYPAFAPIYEAFDRRNKNASALMSKYVDILKDFKGLSKGQRHRLHELGANMRDLGHKAQVDNMGRLVDGDGNIRITDPKLVKGYLQMQKAYKAVLDDRFKEVIAPAYEEFSSVLGSPDFGIQDVEAAIIVTEGTGKTRLENLLEVLKGYERMKNVDYVPAMRFGDWGITVRDNDTGEQVALMTAENGLFKDRYDKFQMETMQKKLIEKYSDTQKYDVIGDKGKIKNFDKLEGLVPFKMTYALKAGQIDSRFINIELLGSLLNKDNLDQEAYATVRNQVYDDIMTKGFKKHFTEAEFLDGYSTDWIRAQHAYLSSAAHHLANIPFQKELAVMNDQVSNLRDDVLKKRAQSFIDYNTSPHEDLTALRTFNFLWTMGGNVSSAVLQLATLPTTTLAGMAQFSPNPIKNMALIGKWFKLGIELAPTGFTMAEDSEGIVHLAFDDEIRLKEMMDQKKMTLGETKLIKQGYKGGKTRGMTTEESLGSRQFETRSLQGNARGKMRTAANYLGMPLTVMEQLTRFATTMAMNDLLTNDPQALKRAKKIHKNNPLFDVMQRQNPDRSFAELASEFTMDEAHGVFGKLGRPEYMRNVGGAVFFPFMTYPQYAIEFMVRMMFTRGQDGRRGAYTALTALFLMSGLMGLPGAELLKELLEEIEKQATGSEEDFDLLIREKVHAATGSPKFAKFVTQGAGRGFAGLDISGRFGLAIPGQDILLNVLGIRGDSSDMLGVSGSLMTSVGDAWSEYNNGASGVKVASAMLPTAPANLLKSLNYAQEGVSTRKGVKLVTPEDISKKSIISRAIGVTSDQIATKREELYYSQLLEKKHTTAVERYRNTAKNLAEKIDKARSDKKFKRVKSLEKDLKEVLDDFMKYNVDNGLKPDLKSFMRSVNDATRQRRTATIRPKDVRKAVRGQLGPLQEVLGVK